MDVNELLNNPSELSNSLDLIKDIVNGDPEALKRFEGMNLDKQALKTALDFLMSSDLEEKDRAQLVSESWRINFKSKPPTPEEFVSEKYLGPAAKHTYQWVKDTFIEFMDPSKAYRNLILYPHIGWGKSYLSTLITLYVATHLNLMRNPWKFFGLNPSTQLSQLLVSYSLKKSSELLLEPFMSLLEASPFFERVQRKETMQTLEQEFANSETVDKLYWTTAYPTSALGFSSGSTIKIASSPNGLLGLSIISIVYSELAFFTDAGKTSEYIMRLYNDGRARVRSRLETNTTDPDTGDKIVNYYGRTILDSSPNDMNNAIDEYIVNKAPSDKTNYIISGSRWKWRPDEYKKDFETGNVFKVFLGGRGNPPRILDPNDPILVTDTADKSKIVDVPGSFRQVFIDDLPKALKDWAGIPTGSANSLIYDYSIIEKMFNNKLRNIYLNITASANLPPTGLIWNQVWDKFFIKRADQYEYYYKPWAPRCISIDQSFATDVTCISMSHMERYYDTGENIYVVDFCIPIVPSKNEKVNLEAIRVFIEDLKNKGNLRIEHISFDRFESETTIQNLQRQGFNVEKLSVDISMDPYLNMISLMNQGRIAAGKNIFLKNNLKSLHIKKAKTDKGRSKIDHDNSRDQVLTGDTSWENSFIGSYGKDVSDAVCASIELCRKHYLVVEDNWTGGPKNEELSQGNQKSAQKKTTELLTKLGLYF